MVMLLLMPFGEFAWLLPMDGGCTTSGEYDSMLEKASETDALIQDGG